MTTSLICLSTWLWDSCCQSHGNVSNFMNEIGLTSLMGFRHWSPHVLSVETCLQLLGCPMVPSRAVLCNGSLSQYRWCQTIVLQHWEHFVTPCSALLSSAVSVLALISHVTSSQCYIVTAQAGGPSSHAMDWVLREEPRCWLMLRLFN